VERRNESVAVAGGLHRQSPAQDQAPRHVDGLGAVCPRRADSQVLGIQGRDLLHGSRSAVFRRPQGETAPVLSERRRLLRRRGEAGCTDSTGGSRIHTPDGAVSQRQGGPVVRRQGGPITAASRRVEVKLRYFLLSLAILIAAPVAAQEPVRLGVLTIRS